MRDLTLVIPAKNESDSLPKVLEEIKNFDCKIIIVLERSDTETINSIKNFNCEVVYQSGKGYGNALIEGINNTKTDFLCIFNADGSFNPKYLNEMLNLCKNDLDFVFASRYMKNGGSDDDTFLTTVGNFIFSMIGKIFFSLRLSDILYTFLLGKTYAFKNLDLKSDDFCLCVEMPIKARRLGMNFIDTPSYERKRIAGKKKVNEFRDGFKILIYMIKSFFKF
ncbi:glycosyltransferase family 2 protein [Candidatus Pelagibacter sp.]|jgi:glycosyltransferase involved in cell wall biosynthesis|nr:glycosyltransferase family 2 protein [Candidatus Pelagibacter sp.]